MQTILGVDSGLCIRLAETLFHFLWQGAVTVALVWGVGFLLRRASSHARYWMFVAALAFMAACPVATFFLLAPSHVASPVGATITETQRISLEEKPTLPITGKGIAVQRSMGDQLRPSFSHPAPAPLDPPLSPAAENPHQRLQVWTTTIDLQRLAPMIVAGYLAGVLLMLGRLLLAWCGGNSLRKRACEVDDAEILRAFAQAAEALRMRAAPALAWCGQVMAPTVVGLLKPTILLPLSLSSGLTPGQIELLLLHELAHLRRLDQWINMTQWVIETALFFHPAVWLVSRRIRIERELSCDDMVIATGVERDCYADSLLRMAEISKAFNQPGSAPAMALGADGRRSKFGERILRLIEGPKHESIRLRRTWPLGVMVAVFVVSLVARLDGKDVNKIVDAKTLDMKDGAHAQASTAEEAKPYTVALPDGSSFELVGVSDNVKNNTRWWRPDGSQLATSPLDQELAQQVEKRVRKFPAGQPPLAYAIRVKHRTLDGMGFVGWRPMKGGLLVNRDADQKPMGDMMVLLGEQERKASFTLIVDDAAHAFKATYRLPGNRSFAYDDGAVTFQEPHEVNGELFFSASIPYTFGTLGISHGFTVFDRAGRRHVSEWVNSRIKDNLGVREFRIPGLRLAELDRIEFEVKHFYAVVFGNIALEPGKKTDFVGKFRAPRSQIFISNTGGPASAAANTRKVELPVRDQAGKPVAGAEVVLIQHVRIGGKDQAQSFGPVLTDARGIATFMAIPVLPKYTLAAYARVPGKLTGIARDTVPHRQGRAAQPFEVTMRPVAVIQGKVTAPAGYDLSRLKVRVLTYMNIDGKNTSPLASGVYGNDLDLLPWSFTSDVYSDGIYVIPDMPLGGKFYLAAEGPGLGQGQAFAMSGPSGSALDFNISLAPEGQIEGTVAGMDGKPVAGATVLAHPESGYKLVPSTAVTDEAGHYMIHGLRSGKYAVQMIPSKPLGELTAAATGALSVNGGQTIHGVDFKLGPGALVHGIVKDSRSGKPLAEAEIAVLSPGEGGIRVGSAITGPDGRYTVRIPAGSNHLYVMVCPDGYVFPKDGSGMRGGTRENGRDLFVKDGEEISSGADFVLDPKGPEDEIRYTRATGRVLDEHGQPLAGMVIRQNVKRPDGMRLLGQELGKSGADGRYDVQLIVGAEYQLMAGGGDYGFARSRSFTSRDRTIQQVEDLKLARATSFIGGRVLGLDGQPVQNAMVMLGSERNWRPMHLTTDAEGRFRLEKLVDEPVEVSVMQSGKQRLIRNDLAPGRTDYAFVYPGLAWGQFLTNTEAARLAATVANAECERLYQKRPFTPGDNVVELDNIRWQWGRLDRPGRNGFAAAVSFNKEGLNQQVEVKPPADSTTAAQSMLNSESILLLGMKVSNLTPELKKQNNISANEGVLVLDPGENVERLGIGKLKAGDCFFMVGEKKVRDIQEVVSEILRIQWKPVPFDGEQTKEGNRGRVLIAYEHGSGRKSETQTHYLRLSSGDEHELQALALNLGVALVQRIAAEPNSWRVQGAVRDAQGQPLAHALIQIREKGKPGQRSIQAPDVNTDRQGHYRFNGITWPYTVGSLIYEPFDLGRSARFQYAHRSEVFNGNKTVDFKFEPFPTGGAGFSGRVLDEQGAVVKAYTLTMEKEKRDQPIDQEKDYDTFGYRLQVSSDDGRFSLSGLPAGKYAVTVAPEGRARIYEYLKSQSFNLKEGANEQTITLTRRTNLKMERFFNPETAPSNNAIPTEPGGGDNEISGRVIDSSGRPLEGVRVDAWTWQSGNETTTDKQGRFILGNLKPLSGKVEIHFTKEGYSPLLIGKQPVGKLSQPAILNNRTWFEGTVTGTGGNPVANALVRANQGQIQGPGWTFPRVWVETRSDKDGKYKLLVQEGEYEIKAQAPDGRVGWLQGLKIRQLEAKRLDLPVGTGVTFQARVVDRQTSQPVAGVRLWNPEFEGQEGRSDASGNIRIMGLKPGPFEFEVEAKGYVRWWSEACVNPRRRWRKETSQDGWQRNFDFLDFELKEGMAPVTIVVERGVRITGRILDPDGKPVAGATAAPALTGTGASLTGDTRFSVKSKADGTFELLLPASHDRQYNLVAHDGARGEWRTWANGVGQPFQTKPGDEIRGVELRLTRPCVVRGKVVDTAGKPVANRDVRALACDRLENSYYDPTTKTAQDGRFELKFVRPGKHQITAAPVLLNADESKAKQVVAVTADHPTEGIQLEVVNDDH